MKNLWNAEPTLILAVVQAGLALGMAFGLNISAQQMALILTFSGAVLALVNRSQVTSPQTLSDMTPKTLAAAQDASDPVKQTVRKLPVVLLACVLSFGAVALPACLPHTPPTITTPQGQTAFKADQVVLRVNEFQNTVIALNASGEVPLDTARTLIQFCVGANRVLAATPLGWQTALITLWFQTKTNLPPQTNPALIAAMSTVDAVIRSLQ